MADEVDKVIQEAVQVLVDGFEKLDRDFCHVLVVGVKRSSAEWGAMEVRKTSDVHPELSNALLTLVIETEGEADESVPETSH